MHPGTIERAVKWGDTAVRNAAILTFLAIFPIQQIAAAQEFPKSPSTWYGETRGKTFCLQITEPLVPIIDSRPTPKKCATISAVLSTSGATSHGDLVSGYFCQDQSQVGLFTLPLPSDNSMSGPNIFLGKLHLNRITGAYYVIESNDFPTPYIGVGLDFNKVEKCVR
jgi:hypothetical protein